jgi:membrane-associated PAP2 superfamily phosphatase
MLSTIIMKKASRSKHAAHWQMRNFLTSLPVGKPYKIKKKEWLNVKQHKKLKIRTIQYVIYALRISATHDIVFGIQPVTMHN